MSQTFSPDLKFTQQSNFFTQRKILTKLVFHKLAEICYYKLSIPGLRGSSMPA